MYRALVPIRFGKSYAELGQFDEARRCISEAMTAIETSEERWYKAEFNRIAGEIALHSPEPDAHESARVFRACARRCPPAASQSPGNSAQQ